jgi:hypothetical protein
MLYVEASLPLLPSECDLLHALLNEKIARGGTAGAHRRPAGDAACTRSGPVASVVPALEWSESGFASGWQVLPRLRFPWCMRALATSRARCHLAPAHPLHSRSPCPAVPRYASLSSRPPLPLRCAAR